MMRLICFVLALALLATAAPQGGQECGENEEYSTCHTACPPTCEPPKSNICPAICKTGCGCKQGYLLNSRGQCVTSRDC
ncbi:hypothetical protein FQR65_LT08546 [Abscondita terminalis]|nr:hypothetical protein FQR65_LT08546 [Abscondita terminalis]